VGARTSSLEKFVGFACSNRLMHKAEHYWHPPQRCSDHHPAQPTAAVAQVSEGNLLVTQLAPCRCPTAHGYTAASLPLTPSSHAWAAAAV
jgi:hypothetical protein